MERAGSASASMGPYSESTGYMGSTHRQQRHPGLQCGRTLRARNTVRRSSSRRSRVHASMGPYSESTEYSFAGCFTAKLYPASLGPYSESTEYGLATSTSQTTIRLQWGRTLRARNTLPEARPL